MNAEAQPETAVDTILRAGQLVDGEYRVERLLGQGGMAAVWAGTNERTGKRVALKVILRSLASTRLARGLFHSEALAASLVNHPNVVTVFDIIEHEGMACIVMELLDGEPLGSYIARKGPLSVKEATKLLLPAMRGVAAANAQGVVHRDLKPQNIFICMEPDGRIVTTKVLDFGISVAWGAGEPCSPHTIAGRNGNPSRIPISALERGMGSSAEPIIAMGTPAYMSPEHLLSVPDIDARADVYGFGLLLYETLTGQTPFPGEPSPDLFDRVLHRPAPPVALTRPDLPPGLVRIIEKAMAKDREQRYANVNSMAAALEDELMPPTPAPRLLTPLTGVPLFVAPNPLNALAAESVEPSGPYYGGREGSVPPVTTGRDTAPVELKGSLRKTRSSGIGAPLALLGWAGLASALFAVTIGVFAVSVAMRGARRVQRSTPASIASATPPTTQPVVHPAVPAVISTAPVDPVAPPPLTVSRSQPLSDVLATGDHRQSLGQASDMVVRSTSRHSRVEVSKTPTDLWPGRRVLRRASRVDAPAWASPAVQRPRGSAKFAEPRAGRLSKDDF